MISFRSVAVGLALSVLCSFLSVSTVELVASRGVEIDIGSGPIRGDYEPGEYDVLLKQHRVRIEDYKKKYREENNTWFKRHLSYKPYAWKFTWWPWLLLGLLSRSRSRNFFIGLLSIPCLLALFDVFFLKEVLCFAVAVLFPFFVKKWVKRDILEPE